MNKFKYDVGYLVRFVNTNGWVTKVFQIETIYPSTCEEGHRYYGRDIDGKAFAAHETEIYDVSIDEVQQWEKIHGKIS